MHDQVCPNTTIRSCRHDGPSTCMINCRVGGSLPVLFPYNSEFVRNKYRGPFLSLQGLFWMLGRFMCGGLAWILIPMTSIQPSFGSFRFHSWRIFLALSALPSILGALLYLVMPETPRYLLEAGKEGKALKILQMVYRINHLHKKDVPEYPVIIVTVYSLSISYN